MFFKRAKQNKTESVDVAPDAAAGDQATGDKKPEPAAAPSAVDPESLGFRTTADVDPARGPVGQSRALEALAFGAGIRGAGYNILVVGSPGSGCAPAARASLADLAAQKKRPADCVYLSYFDDDGGFRALSLPPGSARKFAAAMTQAIDRLADALPAAFATDDYELKRRAIEEEFRFSREDALDALRREAETQNIALLRTPAGIAVAPILEGKVVRKDVFNSVPEALRREVETKIAALENEIEQILSERPGAEKARRERLLALNDQIAGRQVRAVLDEIRAEFADVAGMERYLNAAGRDLVRNAGLFLAFPARDGVTIPAGTIGDQRFARYRVHVMAAAGEKDQGAPVIDEPNPTYANLFGRIDIERGSDGHPARVNRIRPGALHRANGGFLILDARELLAQDGVVEALTRALDTGELRFDPPTDAVAAAGEIPELEPIPLDVKIVVVADPDSRKRLAKGHPHFVRHFKAEAVFDDAVERSSETIGLYARRIAGIVSENDLKPLEAEGVALLIDEASRMAGGNGMLSTEIAHIADLCREADHWAASDGGKITSAAHVKRALNERKERAEVSAEAAL
jgi:hypothetical protein